ncbi:hypothetical protein BN946_scf185006.g18 [Trametes cinnabarina]|uniref:Major facilitator superfamily (MFS) profile domain-containing protein n=1 Tax=Pycnoporus cinnabarinus TaxID=5643 RepID=A0A060SRZ9_PYCCI|nr:hypothetical protein BN946_scf185006.g18 [Trametes cinnabarina]
MVDIDEPAMGLDAPESKESPFQSDCAEDCAKVEAPKYDTHEAAAAWTKLDLTVLPVVTMIYFLSSLDRSNIGNARIAGLQKQLKMSDDQYSIVLTATLITYTLIDIPSNLVIKVAFFLLSRSTCRRFILDGDFNFVMFSATSLASAFSGLLAAAILNMEGIGSKPGWAWLFILEGLFTVLFGVTCYFMLSNAPAESSWLSDDEKIAVVQALRQDGIISRGEQDASYTLANCVRTFLQPHVLLIMVIGFLNGRFSFLPSIVSGLGYSGTRAQLMSVPPFAVAAVLSVMTAFFADRFGQRGLNIIFFAATALVGFSIFYASHVDHIRYGSLFLLVPGTYCIGPPLGTWTANNSAPYIRRATALAILPMMTNLGSILSTWLLGAISPAPRYTSATITLLVFQIGIIVCAVMNMMWLAREGRRKARARALGLANGGAEPSIVGESDDSIWFEYVM